MVFKHFWYLLLATSAGFRNALHLQNWFAVIMSATEDCFPLQNDSESPRRFERDRKGEGQTDDSEAYN